MSSRAELVLVEPGAAPRAPAALQDGSDQNHVLLSSADESHDGFQERVLRRAEQLRSDSHELCRITYVVGSAWSASWGARQKLLSKLCQQLSRDGSVLLLAPAQASAAVLNCIGQLQASAAPGLELRALFEDISRHKRYGQRRRSPAGDLPRDVALHA